MNDEQRVLVIEDEESIGQVVADVLADEGYDVRWAANGREGLALLQAWQPDVIVLDLMMPVMDGVAFRTAQRRLPGLASQVPVIILSGARDARAKAEEMGAAATITKPFDLDDVIATVRRILSK